MLRLRLIVKPMALMILPIFWIILKRKSLNMKILCYSLFIFFFFFLSFTLKRVFPQTLGYSNSSSSIQWTNNNIAQAESNIKIVIIKIIPNIKQFEIKANQNQNNNRLYSAFLGTTITAAATTTSCIFFIFLFPTFIFLHKNRNALSYFNTK